MIFATGGTAFAFVTGTAGSAATLTADTAATLSVGASNQALPDVTLKFPAAATAQYLQGEQIEFTLGSDGAGPAGTTVNDGSNTLNTAAFAAAPTVSADNGVASPAATVALANATGTNDAFKITFNADGPANSKATNFTISGLKVNLGAKVDPGQTITITATTTVPATAIFWNGAAASTSASVNVGQLPLVSLTTSAITANSNASSQTLGTLTIKDLAGGNLKAGDDVQVKLTNAVWTKAPTAGGSPAVASVAINGTTSILDVTIGATASKAGDALTLTGGVVDPTAAGKVTVDLVDATTPIALSPTGVEVSVYVAQQRFGANDRYGTAQVIFAHIPAVDTNTVVLTSGTSFADALSAQYVANALSVAAGDNVGILTTDPNTLTSSTKQTILNAGIGTVYIIGGTAAVSQGVADEIASLDISNAPLAGKVQVVRIAGADRYATNEAADTYFGVSGATHAYVATGENFADALAIGPAVFASGDPLVLTAGASLSDAAKSTLEALGITNVTIVGGTAAVSSAVETSIKNLNITVDNRLAGTDRTGTAAAIATWETTSVANGGSGLGFTLGNVYIARGDSFADALVAGVLAGANDNPILLTTNADTLGAGIPSIISGKAGTVDTLTALGLTAAVSSSVMNAAIAALA